jgi:hypothetical protein
MDLEDAGSRVRFQIRDRDGKYPALFDEVLKNTGTEIVLSGIQMPRMNAVTERRVLTCRRELLDRTLIWNQAHLLHALRGVGLALCRLGLADDLALGVVGDDDCLLGLRVCWQAAHSPQSQAAARPAGDGSRGECLAIR